MNNIVPIEESRQKIDEIDKELIFADSELLCEDTQDVKFGRVSLVIKEDISAVYASNIELYLSNLLQCDVSVKIGGERDV